MLKICFLLFSYVLSQKIPVYIALKQRNIDLLKHKLEEISDPSHKQYGNYMGKDEINTYIHPPKKHQNLVKEWLFTNNIENIKLNGDNIKFIENIDKVNTLFKRDGLNKEPSYTLPDNIKPLVDFVEMYANKKVLNRKSKINIKSKDTQVDDRYFGRESLKYLYNLTHTHIVNRDVTGGIVEYQNNAGFTNDDLNLQQQSNSQTLHNITKINGTNEGTDAESELDVQLLSQGADGVNIYYYDSPYWLYSFATDLYNSKEVPDVISMSWGWAEDSQCDIIDCTNITSRDYVDRVNTEYIKLGLRGVTITVSSGDAGAPGRTSEDCDVNRPLNAVFPGSSPYVLSIGATYVENDDTPRKFKTSLCKDNNCIQGINESVISFDKVGWTSGGGFSQYVNSTPKWQRHQVGNYLFSGVTLPNHNNFNPLGRSYPDVSAIGHSCPTYIDGYLNKIDGTSCSSPVVASLLVTLNDVLTSLNKSKLGFANPFLYSLSEKCPHCFNEVNTGHNWCTEEVCCDDSHNFGFEAITGYDPVGGLGTLNIGNIIEYLKE